MSINFRYKPTYLDTLPGGENEWSTGTGSIGVFTVNGNTTENARVLDTDPFGNTSVVWETRPDDVSGPDGGWNTSYFSIDNTKTYRFSVWIRRTLGAYATAGNYYFGCTGSPGGVISIDLNSTETNPFWNYEDIVNLTLNTWYLFVGHILPIDYQAGDIGYPVIRHPNSGRYTQAGEKTLLSGNLYGDCKFGTTTTSIRHRVYHNYSTTTSSHLQFFDPRIELVDGSEPTIAELLSGESTGDETNLMSTSITKDGAMFKHQNVVATGGDIIKESGEWRIHMFESSGSFVLSSYVGSSLMVDYLIVAGGGGAGEGSAVYGGAGGAGGVLSGYCYLTGSTYTITVGAGGASSNILHNAGYNGNNSEFNGLTATGGGGGGSLDSNNGRSGGSGGGAVQTGTGGNNVGGQGNIGGNGIASSNGSGAGGGYSSAGASASSTTFALGGAGNRAIIDGRPILYSGGGYGNYGLGAVNPTGENSAGTYLGYYGYGANGVTYSVGDSPYDGNNGVVIIRYKYR